MPEQTNPRYTTFKQSTYTAGDENQFLSAFRDCAYSCGLESNTVNIENDIGQTIWTKYCNVEACTAIDTFRYIFHKFKKGIFIKIVDNELVTFLPFSKANYVNEWSHCIHVDTSKFKDLNAFLKHIYDMENRPFNPNRVHGCIENWYGNNCLIRYEYQHTEGDTNVDAFKAFFTRLLEVRKVPDIECFLNRRDFPLLTLDGTEPYHHIWGSKHKPLVSHAYDKYLPILSMTTSERYADIAIPTWDDWKRISQTTHEFETCWENKKATAVFRGGSTGPGVTIKQNMRLKACYLSRTTQPDASDGVPYLDCGITNWNLRPRKLVNSEVLQTIELKNIPYRLSQRLTPEQQSTYKYILHLDGHVAAFRLSIELAMRSVVLIPSTPWKLWYSHLLEPYVHYVPVRADLSDLVERVKWCKEHDKECKQIAENAYVFYTRYLEHEGVMNHMQRTLSLLAHAMGTYPYPSIPLRTQLVQNEKKYLNTVHMDVHRLTYKDSIATTRSTCIEKHVDVHTQKEYAIKSIISASKVPETVHEAYIGMHVVNEFKQYARYFAYTYAYVENKNKSAMIVSQYIPGETLYSYLTHTSYFEMDVYLSVIVQLCSALEYAQECADFVHYDLTPWNIVLTENKNNKNAKNSKEKYTPVMIDYGKAYAVSRGRHHGYVKMYSASSIQDVYTLLVTTLACLTKKTNPVTLSKKHKKELITLSNFLLTGTERKFTCIKDIAEYTNRARKYERLLMDKRENEIEQQTPLHLRKYIYTHLRPLWNECNHTNLKQRIYKEEYNEETFLDRRKVHALIDKYIHSSSGLSVHARTFLETCLEYI